MPDYNSFDAWLGGLLPGGVAPGTLPGGGAVPFTPGAAVVSGSAATGGLTITAPPQSVSVLRAPKGYVLVTLPNGSKIAMLAKVAYALGLKKRPTRGGGITGREVQAARRVQAFVMSLTTARKPKMPIKKGRR